MLRQGYKILTGNSELDDAIHDLYKGLEVDGHLCKALQYERGVGGGAVLLGINDGANLISPLEPAQAQKLMWVRAMDASELWSADWDTDIESRHYLQLRTYNARIVTGGILPIHRSRMLIFPGIFVNNIQHRQNMGWGDSITQRVYRVLQQYASVWGAVSYKMNSFSQPVIQIKGLAEYISNNDKEFVQHRAEGVAISKSVANCVFIDEDESYTEVGAAMAGISDILHEFMVRVASAADMPVTLLFGISPAGLNATGDSDIRQYYDRIRAWQVNKLQPRLEYLTEIAIQVLTSQPPRRFKIEWNPLWQPTSLESAQMRKEQAEIDAIEIDKGIATPEEIADSRHGGDEWTHKTELDWESRDKFNPKRKLSELPMREKTTEEERANVGQSIYRGKANGIQPRPEDVRNGRNVPTKGASFGTT